MAAKEPELGWIFPELWMYPVRNIYPEQQGCHSEDSKPLNKTVRDTRAMIANKLSLCSKIWQTSWPIKVAWKSWNIWDTLHISWLVGMYSENILELSRINSASSYHPSRYSWSGNQKPSRHGHHHHHWPAVTPLIDLVAASSPGAVRCPDKLKVLGFRPITPTWTVMTWGRSIEMLRGRHSSHFHPVFLELKGQYLNGSCRCQHHFWQCYLVVHPTNRKWVITLVINGISGGNVHL